MWPRATLRWTRCGGSRSDEFGLAPALLRVLLAIPIAIFAFWPGLAVRLGRWYLPIFAIYYALSPSVMLRSRRGCSSMWRFILQTEPSLALLFAMEDAWTLFVMLLFGVVIIAWQYDMRRVLWYGLLLAMAELFALSPLLLSSLPRRSSWGLGGIHATIYIVVGFVKSRA